MLTHPKPTVRVLCKLDAIHSAGGVAARGILTAKIVFPVGLAALGGLTLGSAPYF